MGWMRNALAMVLGLAVVAGVPVSKEANAQPAVPPSSAEVSDQTWPVQVKQFMGLTEPQDPQTLPVTRATDKPASAPVTITKTAPLSALNDSRWTIGGWSLVAQPETKASAGDISSPGFSEDGWLTAVVPGTALTSYVANGVYPDPAHGLNNMLIPERLSRQDYWYRTEFTLPEKSSSESFTVKFNGINYASEVWINGERLGTTRGAFIRGRFEIPAQYQSGDQIAVAVRVSPPPHPGIPHEESLTAGAGKNGGVMTIDGPTFFATEGWDWIPGVRDRNTGIWQDVVLEKTGAIRVGDPFVQTVLPNADNSQAHLTIEVPVINSSDADQTASVTAKFGNVSVEKSVVVAANNMLEVIFTPSEFSQLIIQDPELWWPNGYGEAKLHNLMVDAKLGDHISDTRAIRFGIREVSYDLYLIDQQSALKRVTVAPAKSAREQLIDVRHEKIRKVDGGWAVSLATPISSSPALAEAEETGVSPDIMIRVNGVPIAVRGGNWGMDDWLKRVSRERLEPYFRLHREANVNTIRNWVGQNTEEAFFELADEHGLLVLNDFWISTQDHNGEPGDTAMFLDNATDTVSRIRHHASIALWIGRNEGVPPPFLNEKLDELVREMDGTRAYMPNSRQVNMSGSGPWNYRTPDSYFTKLAQGFSTEVGTPSFPTLETFKTMMPEADLWPISDNWAYHDWHQGGAGGVASFMKAMTNRFGAPTDLEDFEKKAQLLNYESHRAIYEGMNAGLFTRNSGRLLWMTHPAWPSTAWQIYSHDYDTHAAFFGAKAGMEPVHVQVNLPTHDVAIVNSLTTDLDGARVKVSNYDLTGKLLDETDMTISAPALGTTATDISIADSFGKGSAVVLSKLELYDAAGGLISDNFYWLAKEPDHYRSMAKMKPVKVKIAAQSSDTATEIVTRVQVTNTSDQPALMLKLTLLDEEGNRILPAYWSDNYISLMPGETKNITITTPANAGQPRTIGADGWNLEPSSIAIAQ